MGTSNSKLAWVDLSTGRVEETVVDFGATAGLFPGGAGLALSVFLQLTENARRLPDPLAPENPLVFAAGPLAGTPVQAASRMVVCARSPQTGLWGESNLGGFAPAALRRAGYAGLVVTGKAEQPSYVDVGPAGVAVRACPELWGLDTYEVYARLRVVDGPERGARRHVLAIGPAGEALVPFAAIVHDRRHIAGRTGMGAAMGSKNLKAVVVSPGEGHASMADPAGVAALRQRLAGMFKEYIPLQTISILGTPVSMDTAVLLGTVPIQNWRRGEWEEGLQRLTSVAYQEKLGDGRATCYGCPVACKREVSIGEGPEAQRGPGPEYETLAALGSMLLVDDVVSIARANELCNRMGLDTISTGAVVAAATEAVELGLIGDSLPGLVWGDPAPVLELIPKIARREGAAGRLLSGGVRRLVDQLGPAASDLSIHVKGLEVPMHDPRSAQGMAVGYAVSTRGACHRSTLNMNLEYGYSFYPEVGLEGPYDEKSSAGKAAMTVASEDLNMIFGTAAVICALGGMGYSVTDLVDALTAVTGRTWTAGDIMREGRRLWLAKRALNFLMGARKADDTLPKRLRTALTAGYSAGYQPDILTMIEEYYRLRDLDEDGRPAPEAVADAGLPGLAETLAEAKPA